MTKVIEEKLIIEEASVQESLRLVALESVPTVVESVTIEKPLVIEELSQATLSEIED
jgi:hypothetical protein